MCYIYFCPYPEDSQALELQRCKDNIHDIPALLYY